jgi:RNA polymerase-binding transcription factor DksA
MSHTLRALVPVTSSVQQVSEPSDEPRTPVEPDRDTAPPQVDLGAIERDLAGVESALRRLDDGSYWTDEVSGDPIPDTVLADDPVARQAT